MFYIFREQSDNLRCVSKRKSWIKGERTESLIKILQGWGNYSVFHVVKASSQNRALIIAKNYQIDQSIEWRQNEEYIETIIIDIGSENESE